MIIEADPPSHAALRLPFDFHPTPGAAARRARHSFRLTLPDGGWEARLAAAFGALLFRYGAQSPILLQASRLSADGEPRGKRPLTLSIADATSGRDVLIQAEEALRRAGAERVRSAAFPPARGGDLLLAAARDGGTVRAEVLYDAGLFKPSTIERLARHLAELSGRLADDPDAPVSKRTFLPPSERRWIESVCDGPRRGSPAEFVHRSFEARTAAAPGATALRHRDLSMTYGELNARANVLARWMSSDGIGAESRVVVCLEPSFDVAVALLAVLKAGAVYVPLDPSYPLARLRACLEDIHPKLVLTRAHLKAKLPLEGIPSLELDGAERLAKGLCDADLELPVQPDQTAYIYFTSGTTGKPKGAAASQANLASYIRAARERYGIRETDAMPAIARFSFSISMFELMSPLAAGGTLVLLDRDHILDLDRLSRTLEAVTIFHAGPSLLKNLLKHIERRYADFGAFSGVRHASSGGDMVPPEVLEGLKRVFRDAEVFVIYGCSEISCMGCTYPVAREGPVERTYVGRPFDNMSVRVLDPALNLLPPGIAGEIYFAGDGIVKGYWNRPDLTAERFLELDGRRFYRTGDLGRLTEDGWLEILGRSDFQVKLRGMRVELAEVEHHLRRAAGVRDGVVAARRLEGDEKALVAYVVMEQGGARDGAPIAAIRRHMAEHLPDYMVPATYVELERLPLNHNMKVDRRALPEPSAADRRAAAGERVREPRTETERRLAALWMKLLKLDRVGADDHFFDLGGHSVLGVELILDVERELGVVLGGMEVLRESLEGQAAICDRRLGKAPEARQPAARPAPRPDEEDETFYFGEGGSLYGVLSGASGAGEAVLICPSVGQEQVRAHFILRRLARRLAARGVPALRFDYFGCGDSLGESLGATCGRWRRDIREAFRELRRRTGAARVSAVGVRLGAALLADAADGLELDRLVVWDPVRDGAQYADDLAAAHETYVRSWRWLFRRPPACAEGATELLGLLCSAENMGELRSSVFAPSPSHRLPLKWLATSDAAAQTRRFQELARERGGSRLEVLDFDPGWNDAAGLGNLLPDVGISAALAAMATERA